MGTGIKTVGKFNCPAKDCNAHSESLANLIQHVDRSHKLRDKYLLIDRENGRIWTANRLPAEVTENAPKPQEITVAA